MGRAGSAMDKVSVAVSAEERLILVTLAGHPWPGSIIAMLGELDALIAGDRSLRVLIDETDLRASQESHPNRGTKHLPGVRELRERVRPASGRRGSAHGCVSTHSSSRSICIVTCSIPKSRISCTMSHRTR